MNTANQIANRPDMLHRTVRAVYLERQPLTGPGCTIPMHDGWFEVIESRPTKSKHGKYLMIVASALRHG